MTRVTFSDRIPQSLHPVREQLRHGAESDREGAHQRRLRAISQGESELNCHVTRDANLALTRVSRKSSTTTGCSRC